MHLSPFRSKPFFTWRDAMKTAAVIDIGKTNAKVVLVDLTTFAEVAVRRTANSVLAAAPYPHFDANRLWAFILDSLSALHRERAIDAISVTTHGATAVLLDSRGDLALPILDYEHDGPNELFEEYGALRPPFAETGSPRLPCGLNIGAQLYWQQSRFPREFAKVSQILTYAQYWSFRLTGIAATEPTSLGCHTDVWNPKISAFSTLADRQGWTAKFAPVRSASTRLGMLSAAVAEATRLPTTVPVVCGIHDSNASLLPHLMSRDQPFSVVSTGTWVVMLAVGGKVVTLDEARDTLINVNALGEPVPSARFMGGRAFSTLIPEPQEAPTEAEENALAQRRDMLLPSIPEGSGPFPHAKARWTCDDATLTDGERLAAVSFYLALMTAISLDLIGAQGDIIVEGPFTSNLTYLRMLKAATGRAVLVGGGNATGTSVGAAFLIKEGNPMAQYSAPTGETPDDLRAYATGWNEAMQDLG